MSNYIQNLYEGYPLLAPGSYVADPDGDIYEILNKTEYSKDDAWETNYRIRSLMTGYENYLWEKQEFLRQGWKRVSYETANEYYKRYHDGKTLEEADYTGDENQDVLPEIPNDNLPVYIAGFEKHIEIIARQVKGLKVYGDNLKTATAKSEIEYLKEKVAKFEQYIDRVLANESGEE